MEWIKNIDKRIDEVVKRFDMSSFKDQRIGNLSTGQTQRVGVARCVMHDPHNYILDIFKKLAHEDGKCVIIVTHSPNVCAMVD